jgi:histidinol-phosphate/aromatic aminotransferase/cobyric acid decarboxylase-like protein
VWVAAGAFELLFQVLLALYNALAALPGVRVRPSEANFLCFATPRPAQEVRRELLDHGVAVRDVSGLPYLLRHLRVTIGAPGDNRAFLAAMRQVLAGPS